MSANSPSSVKRSSVVDRVRWIEKTHGPANNAGQQPPRARLRLPKNFAEMQQQKISEADGPREPATAAAAGLVQESSLRLPKLGPRKAQQQNQQQPSPPPPVAEESPSPVLSEASTAIAPLVSSKEMAGAKERSEKALAAAAASTTVVSAAAASAATATANSGHLRSVSEASSASSDSLALVEGARTIINAAEEGDECFYSNRDCASSASDLEPADPVHVSESQLQQMQQMQKPRMKSSVTIVAPAGGRSQRRQQKQQNGFKSGSAASPRPAAGGGSAADEAKKSLGGIRSRMRPMSSRRYNKTTDQQSQSQNQGQPRHSPPMSPDLRASKSLTNLVLGSPDYDDDDDEDDENRRNQIQNHHGSLIARLTKLKANRPSAQSLVSNWGAPKFVKRSQFSNTIPVDAKSGRTVAARRQHTVVAPSPAPVPVSFSSYWGRSQKRYK